MPISQQITIASYSMKRTLHNRLSRALPRYGDKSKLVARLLEMWLDGDIVVTNVSIRPRTEGSVVRSSTNNN